MKEDKYRVGKQTATSETLTTAFKTYESIIQKTRQLVIDRQTDGQTIRQTNLD
jgi:hypothetical protein